MQTSKEIEVVVDEDDFSEQQELSIEVHFDGQRYVLEHEVSNATDKGLWRLYSVSAIISTIVFYFAVRRQTSGMLNVSGELSLGTYVTVISFISNLIILPMFLILLKRSPQMNQIKYIYWRNIPTVVISFLIVQLVAVLFVFWSLGQLFPGLRLDFPTAILFAFIIFLISNYIGIYFVNTLSVRKMIRFLMIFLFLGFFVAAATNANSQWWHHHISYLGSYAADHGWRFNLTLLLTSLLMIALVDYLFVLIRPSFPNHRGLRYLYVMLIVIAICIAGIGLFRSDAAGRIKYYHTYVIYVIGIMVALITIFAHKLLPKVSDDFIRISVALGILIFILSALYLTGNLQLILYELITIPIALVWLMTLFNALIALTQIRMTYKINIVKE